MPEPLDPRSVSIATEITAALARAGQLQPAATMPFFAAAAQELNVLLGVAPSAQQSPGPAAPEVGRGPAVAIEASVTEDRLICLEDGKPMKMLKRYLQRRYGMTPAEYRAKWGLPPDYPMSAPRCRAQRSANARLTGLGTYPRKRHG